MKGTLENILFNPENEKVLTFLGIRKEAQHKLISYAEKDFYSNEGLEDFLNMDVPSDSKFILDNIGLIILPETAEITAFHFGRFETAFKIVDPNRFRKNYKHIKQGLLRKLKISSSLKVSLGYFSNVYGDQEAIVDIRELGSDWALSTYFVGKQKELIQEYYQNSPAERNRLARSK